MERELKLECLRLAQASPPGADRVQEAERYWRFISGELNEVHQSHPQQHLSSASARPC